MKEQQVFDNMGKYIGDTNLTLPECRQCKTSQRQIDIQALLNFEKYWSKEPLNNMRRRLGLPLLSQDEFVAWKKGL